ncbi:SPASM domain-containing protein [Methanospirillum sp. J.3.6.1-F.2.7.3]|uniref:SPASM domain-containing protein n=1 Tax=Methanospirillum purgamenti TaxID=2834276 RepID=A0A8E7B298_9EURY|nr:MULTISPECIES: radical SAM protein [Methanospirillum]MDX8551885.1 radical SAM protein [Methanospirillum hungatei]QVV89163.1 SPASM domain-containing protein [Methanospirillum sp. J.3.6.1-F.2.7.3]
MEYRKKLEGILLTSIIKPGYDEKRSLLSEKIPLNTPYSIIITPSSLCNFRCLYCIHSSIEKIEDLSFKKEKLDWGSFLKISQQILEFPQKIKAIHFHGWGEPLLNKNVYRMIKHLKEKKCAEKINLITNGVLLNRKNSLELIESGVDTIKISLQGINTEKYFLTSNVDVNFENLIKNIEYLYLNKKNCEIYVKIADISLDKNQEDAFFKIFENITDRMFIEFIRPVRNNCSNDKMEVIEKSINMYGDPIPPFLVCPLPFYMLHITSSGDVLPCCNYLDPVSLGNIKEKSLKEIWESQKRNEFLTMLLTKKKNLQDDYPICNGCNIHLNNMRYEDELDSKSVILLKKFEIKY